MKLTSYLPKQATLRGFTIIELMVTLGIVVLVTGLVMIRYSSFNSSVLLTSQAYLTGFDIREAQSLAVSVRGNSEEFREEYGMYFTLDTPNQYLLFQDDDSLGETSPAHYDAGEAIGIPYRVDSRFEIVNICATNNSSRTCNSDDPETTGEVVDATLDDLTVTFQRPDFDAALYSPVKTGLLSGEIHFGTADSEHIRKVLVYASGQIGVE